MILNTITVIYLAVRYLANRDIIYPARVGRA
jgi:hypothetical protein